MPKNLKLIWTQHLKTEASRDEFTKTVSVALDGPVFKRLLEILEEKEEHLDKTRSADYDSASWAYKQADNNGARRMLQAVKDLIS